MEEMRSETHWPILKAYLKEGKVTFDDIDLPCGVCQDTMTVSPDQHTKDEDGKTHNAVIFPCGHIFGNSCIEVAFAENSSLRPVCFTCRADLTHPECGHMHPGLPMPCSQEELDSTPHVLAEGGLLSSSCGDCLLEDIAADLVKQVKTFNDSLPSDAGLLMGFTCQVMDAGVVRQCGNRGLSGYEPPEGALPILEHFKEQRALLESDNYWFEGSLSALEWRFYPLEVSPPKPSSAFLEYVASMFSAEGEKAKGMTWAELREEFEGQPRARPSLLGLYLELMCKGDDDDEDDD
jgi:hypothetical protein